MGGTMKKKARGIGWTQASTIVTLAGVVIALCGVVFSALALVDSRGAKSSIALLAGPGGSAVSSQDLITEPTETKATIRGSAVEAKGKLPGDVSEGWFWLVVHRIGQDGYWPVRDPLTVTDGVWSQSVSLGLPDDPKTAGPYLLLLVSVSAIGNMDFVQYLGDHASERSYPAIQLPAGTKIWDWIVVTRTE
jgi:hypothetical protein